MSNEGAGNLPLAGITVIELSQMIMGPCCGLILADLGAEVIKIEPMPHGDRSRRLTGIASGFFAAFNRNKRSIVLDQKSRRGKALVERLIDRADVLIENFRPGLMSEQGLDYGTLAVRNPRLVYCSLKGFMPGPYENRTALDEVVQMMGGLAFTTGQPGKPTRAGASVNDMMGAMFGVIAIQAGLRQRETTGRGQEVQAALFENNAFLMATHILAERITGVPTVPWTVKNPPWPVYDLFDTKDDSQIFVGVVGDGQWGDFCRAFGFEAWLDDKRLQTTADRAAARAMILPEIAAAMNGRTAAEISETCERLGLPFAPVRTPIELIEDPHLMASGGLIDTDVPGTDLSVPVPALPFSLGGARMGKRNDPPEAGADTRRVLEGLGIAAVDIDALIRDRIASQHGRDM